MNKPSKQQLNELLNSALLIINRNDNNTPEWKQEAEKWVEVYNNIVKPNVVQ